MTVLGREHLEGLSRPFVLVSNHASHLDAPLIFGALPRKLARYVAANAAADYFFDVWWRKPLASLFFNAFPVDRTGLRGRRSVATDLLDAGVPLLLFPEGGRSKTGEMGNFKPGAAALCISRDVPAVPVGDRRRGRGDAVRAELAATRAGRRSTSRSASRCGPRTGSRRPSSPSEWPKRFAAWWTTRRPTTPSTADPRPALAYAATEEGEAGTCPT